MSMARHYAIETRKKNGAPLYVLTDGRDDIGKHRTMEAAIEHMRQCLDADARFNAAWDEKRRKQIEEKKSKK